MVVDSNQRVVFSGHIHHDCATVEEPWQLTTDVNGGRLTTSVESIGLRRAFGSSSTQSPQVYSVAWLNEQWRLLKEKAPDLQIAEWSMHPHDRVLYERTLSRAGYNPDDVLPETTSWVSPMQWLQYPSPSLPGYQLGYVGSIRWTAREESLCCSFLQTRMQTSPNDTRDQLLRATSVYLVTEGYFRNPKRIYVRLGRRSRSPCLQSL